MIFVLWPTLISSWPFRFVFFFYNKLRVIKARKGLNCFDLRYCAVTPPLDCVALPWIWGVIKRPPSSPCSGKEAECLQDMLTVCLSMFFY